MIESRLKAAGVLFLSLFLSATGVAQVGCGETWVPGVSPHGVPNRGVDVVKTLDLGAGPELFILGSQLLTEIADQPVAVLAKFDGSVWSPIGVDSLTAVTLKLGRALVAFDDGTGPGPRLYVSGKFYVPGFSTWLEHVGRWDGSGWTLLDLAANGPIHDLIVFDDGGVAGPRLVAGGGFTNIGGVGASRVARWSGTQWTVMGAGPPGPTTKLRVFDDGTTGPRLYAAGVAASAGAALSFWDGTTWVAVGHPGLQSVRAICSHQEGQANAQLFVAGVFTPGSFGVPYVDLARWDGATWTPVGWLGGTINALLSFDDGTGSALQILGGIGHAQPVFPGVVPSGSGPVAWNYARYKNNLLTAVPYTSTTLLHPPTQGGLTTFSFGGVTRLVAAGLWGPQFANPAATPPDDANPDYLSYFDGVGWRPIGSGSWYRRRGTSMVTFDDGSGPKLYAAGQFPRLGNALVTGLGRWNGVAWEPVGVPAIAHIHGTRPLTVHCLAVFDDGSGPRLYLAGTAWNNQYVFRWNGGSSFTQLGSTLAPGPVVTAANSNDTLGPNSLVVWDDGAGPALWIGMDCGDLGASTYVTVSPLRAWRNNSWQTLSQLSGLPNPDGAITRLTVEPGPGGGLVLGGRFGNVGGTTVTNVARLLPGYTVDALGAGSLPGTGVLDLARYDDGNGPKLYALTRTAVTGPGINSSFANLSRYDGTAWSVVRTLPQVTFGQLRTVPFVGSEAMVLGTTAVATSGAFSYSLERYTGSWTSLGNIDGQIYDARVHADAQGGGTFIVGDFDHVGGVPSGSVAVLRASWPTIMTHPTSKTAALGQALTLSTFAIGPPPLTYQWFKNGVALPGATGPSFTVPSASLADAGSYHANVSNACGNADSRAAVVVVSGCQLGITEPFGPGVVAISHASGIPAAHVFTALSLLPVNASSPGTGDFFGLHTSPGEVVSQFLVQAQPFVTTLSAAGTAFWAAPIPAQLIGADVWGISVVYDPVGLTPIGGPSNIAHQLLQ